MLDQILSLFFPNRCVYCGKVIPVNAYCCPSCREQVEKLRRTGCPVCQQLPCVCYQDGACYSRILSPYWYDLRVKDAVLQLKFHGKQGCAKGLGTEMARAVIQAGLAEEIGMVTAVPMTGKDKYRRGYNQAELLARSVAKELQKPYAPLLAKWKQTGQQHTLSRRERQKNLAGAFALKNGTLRLEETDKGILLCDDVCTTGSTLRECAQVLRQAGASKIICCTLAAAYCRTGSDVVK